MRDVERKLSVTHMDPHTLRWVLPWERRVAVWGTNRIRQVQGNSRDLTAGAYVILAAIWGTTGGLLVIVGIAVDAESKSGFSGSVVMAIGLLLLAVGTLRQIQARNCRRRHEP